LESFEDRIVLDYSAAATGFQPINLVDGAPGVFTIMNYADDAALPVDLGANQFNFYNTTYTGAGQLFVSSNALITFGAGNPAFLNGDLAFTPDQAAISPLWTDWLKFSGGPLALGEFDTANNRLIIQWDHILHFLGNGPATFQVILQLNTGNTPGNITFNYVEIDTGDPYANGATATVGIKDAGSNNPSHVEVSYRSLNPLVRSGEAIQFTWINPIPVPSISGFSQPSALEGDGPLTLTVNGTNFTNTAVVQVNGAAVPTAFVSGAALQATLPLASLAEEGNLVITVYNPGSPGETSQPVNFAVHDAPLTATGVTLSAIERQAFSGTVASFTDANPGGQATEFSATIDWGDGTPATVGTISQGTGGSFNVSGDHTYAQKGSYNVTVSVSDQGGSQAVADSTADITRTPPEVTARLLHLGNWALVVGSYSDQDGGSHRAVIDWGDGTTSRVNLGVYTHGRFFAIHHYRSSFLRHHHGDVQIAIRVLADDGTASDPIILDMELRQHHHCH
jgi:hypothetical protein